MLHELSRLFQRDIQKTIDEINAFENEEDLWIIQGEIKNSAGTLALHLNGNLNHFIGAVLGKTGYIRERDREFSDRNVPRAKMVHDLSDTIKMVASVLENLDEAELDKEFPVAIGGETNNTRYTLIHLHAHLNYHLGQINYHRRLLS